jgi:hypothetical protein
MQRLQNVVPHILIRLGKEIELGRSTQVNHSEPSCAMWIELAENGVQWHILV